ncbi:MAG: VOC family protein [Nitrospinota bacterium]|nr:VOC family protein [Nitrospinota bacterium]MDP6618626.1 VOC family protein [Nitrospinota bacterium]
MSPTFDHIGLATLDLERSIAFYEDVMGFGFSSRRRLSDGREQAVFLIGEGILVLFQSPSENYVEKARRVRSGMHHLAFALEPEEYNRVIERCETAGVAIMRQAINSGAQGMGLATYFYDPDGNDIEIKKYDGIPDGFEGFTAEGYHL